MLRFSPSVLLCKLMCMSILIVSACTNVEPVDKCIAASDCKPGELCVEGYCKSLPPSNQMMSQVECLANTDCSENQRCIEGTCYDNQCQDGERRECTNECGTGEQLCAGGVWRSCNKQKQTEVCGNDRDEDCDGTSDEGCSGCIDGEERPCETNCGGGVEQCLNSMWIGCTAPRPHTEICGDPEQPVNEDCDDFVDEGCADCEDGETRACESECGTGTETCSDRTWRGCTAQTPKDELCDGEDNDCDGMTDEEITRDCGTACGPGLERCSMGMWVECSAPESCECGDLLTDVQICGQCGVRQRSCGVGMWEDWGNCMEMGQCVPGEEDLEDCGFCGTMLRTCSASCEWGEWRECNNQGTCQAGEVEVEACSNACGGERMRTCTDECEWGEWSVCSGGNGVCQPGMTEENPCGNNCGQQIRTCTDECAWSDWSDCESPPNSCVPGEVDQEVCGTSACETRSRACDDKCTWEEWGECTSSGSCGEVRTETRDCGLCGTQQRTCDGCSWGEWSVCSGQPTNACQPGEQETVQCGDTDMGLCRYGNMTRVCTDQCQWPSTFGSCEDAIFPSTEICGNRYDEDCNGIIERDEDSFEPNNSCSSCRLLRDYNDDGDPILDLNNYQLSGTIDSYLDTADYFCFEADDGFGAFAEKITVTLTNIPTDADYDLYLYKDNCSDSNLKGSSTNIANPSTGNSGNELIEFTERQCLTGCGDSGLYIIKVKPVSNTQFDCRQNYQLTINGLR